VEVRGEAAEVTVAEIDEQRWQEEAERANRKPMVRCFAS
jgi:hypothetical protein